MGNTPSSVSSPVNVCFADCEAVFNMQQNTFANSMFLDARSEIEYQKSHIDQSHHLKFANKLLLNNNKNTKKYALYKKWLKQIVKLHQSTFSKSKIIFYIVYDNDKNMNLIKNVCQWLNDLSSDEIDNIPQIDTSQYYYLNFIQYKALYSFMCSDHQYYEEGRLFPSQITEYIYLSNWGIASDGFIYKILNNMKYVINVTCDHPNIYNIYDDPTNIYSQQFLTEIEKSMKEPGDNPMFKRQNEKIIELRNEFNDIRLNYIRIPVVDNPTNNIYQYFDQCCQLIQTAITNNSKILIHCRHGQSRSATIVACWLIYNNNCTVDQSLQLIKNKRPRINPNEGFINQLKQWYNLCQTTLTNKKQKQNQEEKQTIKTEININAKQKMDKLESKSSVLTGKNNEKQQIKTETNINEQLTKSINIQETQKNVNKEMNELECKLNLLTSKKEEQKKSDSKYYLYPSTDKQEAEKYKPQKIENVKITEIVNKMDEKSNMNISGSSKWNTGATMETFDYTVWMKQRLEEILLNEISFNNGNIKINEIINIAGGATILLIRKQYKFGFDISFECKWNGFVNGNEKCEGILKMDDVANDEDIEGWLYEISINEDSEANESAMDIMKNSKQIVINALINLIKEFHQKKQA